MAFQYTPGPWRAIDGTVVTVQGNVLVANMSGWMHPEQAQANAELIALAPVMLNALLLVQEWFDAETDHSKEPDFYARVEMCNKAEQAIKAVLLEYNRK